MPDMRYYTVRQVREIKVWANTPEDAGHIASRQFDGRGHNVRAGVAGASISEIRDVALHVTEDGRPEWVDGRRVEA